MKKSIRHLITFVFISLMALMLLAILAVDGLFLESYYTSQKVKAMERAYDEIDEAVMERVLSGETIDSVILQEMTREWEIFGEMARNRRGNAQTDKMQEEIGLNPDDGPQPGPELDEEIREELDNSLVGKLRNYSEKNNITILLIDSSTGQLLVNFGREGDFLARRLQQYILGQGNDSSKKLIRHENYTIERNSDRRSDGRYLESWGYFSDNNTLFLMRMPLASIHDSVILALRFTIGVGLTVLILGSLIIYFMTRRITDPIMKLAALSERMSNLDFDARYDGNEEDEVGVLGHSMNTLSDRLKEAIGELQAANQQLQHDIQEKVEIDDMRKEFIANVSHELKTPIALIQGYAEGLTEGMADEKESRDYYCEVIMDEANKMNKMVRQLLTLTALEFGNDTPVFQAFDITELIQDFINSASILAQQKGAKLSFTHDGPLYVNADEFKIEEVVTNYFSNAVNHIDGSREIRFAARRERGLARISVYNTGKPIPEESIPNLWTKFYKVDKSRTRAYGGSGIGLSIVKAIMDAHGQECGVENVDGGVEFWFTLELAQG